MSLILGRTDINESDISLRIRIAYKLGRFVFSWFLFFSFWIGLRWINKDSVLKASPRRTVRHFYFGYWFCRYILGYKKVFITRIPIPVQYQIICADLFDEYLYNGTSEKKDDSVSVSFVNGETSEYTSCLNLVLADTYGIDWKKQLPSSVAGLTTVIIDRSSDDHTRYYSSEFISEVVSTLRNLPNKVHVVNLFATTNPANNLHIAQEAFMTGGRDSIEHLFVFQQSANEGREYSGKRLRVF